MYVKTEDKFKMYYTGLQRRDRGIISRIGLAESNNLIDWKKNQKNIFPIEPKGIYYETQNDNPRKWLSFRTISGLNITVKHTCCFVHEA